MKKTQKNTASNPQKTITINLDDLSKTAKNNLLEISKYYLADNLVHSIDISLQMFDDYIHYNNMHIKKYKGSPNHIHHLEHKRSTKICATCRHQRYVNIDHPDVVFCSWWVETIPRRHLCIKYKSLIPPS